MSNARMKVVVAVVLALAVVQILLEEILLFLGATGRTGGLLASPTVAVLVPLIIALLLLAILVGGALWNS